ncbi:zinc finger protein 883-like [Adelges cooleyi]|uniref:zinc finger protein 883-like n=1 Tax=Adelges cooleyi TaxID=133065 RepID=UPI00217FAFEE|nr:zinc finger protein 883-like [Adelges cooleyi]
MSWPRVSFEPPNRLLIYSTEEMENYPTVIVKHVSANKNSINAGYGQDNVDYSKKAYNFGQINNKLSVIVKHETLRNTVENLPCAVGEINNKLAVIVKHETLPQNDSAKVDNRQTIPIRDNTYNDARGIEASKFLLTCSVCNKRFNCLSAFGKHKHVHTHKALHECPVCPKMFTRAAHLATHHRLFHADQRPYKCRLCGKHFLTAPGRNSHVTRIHGTHNPYPCHVCYEQFTEPACLVEHLMNAHGLKKIHQCHVCCKIYTTASSLHKHLTCHSVALKHACTLCPNSFATARILGSHLKTQHGRTDATP